MRESKRVVKLPPRLKLCSLLELGSKKWVGVIALFGTQKSSNSHALTLESWRAANVLVLFTKVDINAKILWKFT